MDPASDLSKKTPKYIRVHTDYCAVPYCNVTWLQLILTVMYKMYVCMYEIWTLPYVLSNANICTPMTCLTGERCTDNMYPGNEDTGLVNRPQCSIYAVYRVIGSRTN